MKSGFFRFFFSPLFLCAVLFCACRFIPESRQTETIFLGDALLRQLVPGTASVTVDLGETPKNVYVSVVNSGFFSSAVLPKLRITQGSAPKAAALFLPAQEDSSALSLVSVNQGASGQRGEHLTAVAASAGSGFHEQLNEFNRTSLLRYAERSSFSAGAQPEAAVSRGAVRAAIPAQSEGESHSFYNGLGTGTRIGATCRAVRQDGIKKLYVYVDDAVWNSVGQNLANSVADSFLKPGPANDIYDWVSGIFGEEWGSHGLDYLIPRSDSMTILIYDIPESGVSGFFSSRDVLKASAESQSNERNMIYLDSQQLIAEPSAQKSTLAHEFQHMIQFYQKSVSYRNNGLDTWLNELCSLVAEDFVADKIGAGGPRGSDPHLPQPVPPGTQTGVLPLYLVSAQTELMRWNVSDPLANYAKSYAFGAYLARNYGGAKLFKQIVQNRYTNQDAVTEAVKTVDASLQGVTFFSLLEKWAAAALLSDRENLPAGYRYNSGSSWDSSAVSGILYNLGSINLWNYSYVRPAGVQNGPVVYPIAESGSRPVPPTGIQYYYAGNYSGVISLDLQSVPDMSVRVTVVAK